MNADAKTIRELRPGDLVAERDHVADEIDLFLFSAACWLPHRIHYDQDFARAEGLETVPIHGPLQAAWLIDLVTEWASPHGVALSSSAVRHVNSAYPHEHLHLSVRVESMDVGEEIAKVMLELRIAKDDGTLTTVGTATVVGGSGTR